VPRLPGGRVVVDASYLLALADRNADAARFLAVRTRAVITTINFGEVLYKLAQVGRPAVQTEQIFLGLGIKVDEVSLTDVRHFPTLKDIDAASRSAQHAAGLPTGAVKSLSLADMTCLGYALQRSLPVLTGDGHWLSLADHGLRLAVFDFRDPELTL
jgi:PIN domain nuclease of toxin-antitoxin system